MITVTLTRADLMAHEERARIVAWLRTRTAEALNIPHILVFTALQRRSVEAVVRILADAIERGEHAEVVL